MGIRRLLRLLPHVSSELYQHINISTYATHAPKEPHKLSAHQLSQRLLLLLFPSLLLHCLFKDLNVFRVRQMLLKRDLKEARHQSRLVRLDD